MSVVQIPNLGAAIALNGTEQLEGVQAGTSVRLTVAQIGTYINTQYPAPGISSIATSTPITGGTITSSGTIGLATAGVTNTYTFNKSVDGIYWDTNTANNKWAVPKTMNEYLVGTNASSGLGMGASGGSGGRRIQWVGWT